MPVDRDATLKKAEKLLRQGKLDGAIQEYVRLVEDQPRDWNAANALGDLYVRAGNAERAVAQFTRIADHLHDEGFYAKAAALYKKALKAQAHHEPSLLRLGEMAIRQGLVADAKLYLNQAARLRRERGDDRGADQCVIDLGALPDPDLKLAAARAARGIGDASRAVDLFLDASELFEKQGRAAEALDGLVGAAQADEADVRLRTRAAFACLGAGDVDRARLFLTRESAGDEPDLLLALGRMELAAGRHEEARFVLSRLLAVAPHRAADVMQVADDLVQTGDADAAFDCADAVAETALLGGDLDAAIDALQSLLRSGPHIAALMKLVEVAVDSGRDELMAQTQQHLADAYLDAGRGAEARAIAEDLVARDPHRIENVERLRRALVQVGAADVEAIIARHLDPGPEDEEVLPQFEAAHLDPGREAAAPAAAPADDVVVYHEITIDDETLAPPPPMDSIPQATAERADSEPSGIDEESAEIDLSDALMEIARGGRAFTPPATPVERPAPAPAPEARPRASASAAPTPAPDLEAVFEQMRTRVREHPGTAPAAQLERGLRSLEQGRAADAVPDLEAAARTPMLRFAAAWALGRLYASRSDLGPAVEWLERAAAAPAPSEDDGRSVLYELADALERMGESARALAVLLEIEAGGAAYRDVPARIEQLTRARPGSRGL